MTGATLAGALCADYLAECATILRRIAEEEAGPLARAAILLADEVAADRIICIYAPGGHSNLAAQELFYRAGGLMHLSPTFDAGTALANGAFRSTALQRLTGYGAVIIGTSDLKRDDMLLLVNAFGVNAAVIDAAIEARKSGVTVIGLSSRAAASGIPPDHPSQHPSGVNLHEVADVGRHQSTGRRCRAASRRLATPVGPVATIANTFALNTLVLHTIAMVAERGEPPALWLSRNAAAGDQNNAELVDVMRKRISSL